ncbi:MAG: MFS transporter [Candidatus Omnitrophota bacterium]
MIRFRDVLFKKNFFSLWTGQIISEFGDRLNQMALISLVYSKYPGSVMALAKLLFFIVVPVFVIGPVAGAYVDRWDRKKVMIISDIFRGILVLIIPVFVSLNMMPAVYIAVFLIFSATRFFLPSKMALIPAIVSREKLLIANSLSNTTRMIATVFGLALAGFIVKWVGYIWGFYLDGVSYFISAGLIALITPKREIKKISEDIRVTKEALKGSLRKNLWKEIIEGFGYIFKNDKMKVVTIAVFLLMAGIGSLFCVIIVFVQEAFGSVTEDLGALGIFLGVGLLAGTMLYGKFGQKYSKLKAMFTCFIFCGIGINLFALYSNENPVLLGGGVLLLIVGVFAAPILTCVSTYMHTLIPDEARGRLFSSMEAVIHLAFLFFMFLTAYFSKFVPKLSILLACGGLFALFGIGGRILARNSFSSDAIANSAGNDEERD